MVVQVTLLQGYTVADVGGDLQAGSHGTQHTGCPQFNKPLVGKEGWIDGWMEGQVVGWREGGMREEGRLDG